MIIARHKYDQNYIDEGIKCTAEEKITKQSFTDDCNIEKILERFSKTGQLPESKPKQYGDFSEISDYQTAINVVLKAHDTFSALDAKVRAKFQNDPHAFVAFATDEKNLDAMIDMGLAPKRALNTSQDVSTASTTSSEVKS